ncbi:MBL fold metallo-hydrolase [Paractinoplanes tereljensis]|uniref:MBL fold metallo-hydrolase n=1 Tax=Paractinoplanes tereljensis TaxID=571912 RepID=UPI0033994D70
MREHLARTGRSERDIRAVLLTHGHPDHTGLAAALHAAGADIWSTSTTRRSWPTGRAAPCATPNRSAR